MRGGGGVVLFLMLSGYGLNESFIKSNSLTNYWKNRLIRVYLPYLAVISFQLIARSERSCIVWVLSLLGADLNYNVDPTMWYISYIFVWYFIFYFAKKLFLTLRNKYFLLAKTLESLVFVAGSGICIFLSISGFWHSDSGAIYYSFTFLLGVTLSEYKSKGLFNSRIFWTLILLFFGGITIRFLNGYQLEPHMTIFINFHSIAIMFFAMILLLPLGIRDSFISFLGHNSYAIYLVEGMFIHLQKTLFEPYHYDLVIDIMIIISSIVAGWIIQNCIISPSKNLFLVK